MLDYFFYFSYIVSICFFLANKICCCCCLDLVICRLFILSLYSWITNRWL